MTTLQKGITMSISQLVTDLDNKIDTTVADPAQHNLKGIAKTFGLSALQGFVEGALILGITVAVYSTGSFVYDMITKKK